MTLFEPIDAEASFGGFDLQADCDAADLLKLWEALRVTTPGLWLHSPDCELIKPEQFAKRYAA
jgi:hypothetical protein